MLSYYVVRDWREGCERCKEILRYGGMGHTMSIHSRNEQVILEFGLHKPAYRICVNTPATLGAIGFTTGLDPAMTLGCGGFGGNITSDNISPRHLLNIKRLAYETTAGSAGGGCNRCTGAVGCNGCSQVQPVRGATQSGRHRDCPRLRPSRPPEPIAADSLTRRIDAFLSSRGLSRRHRTVQQPCTCRTCRTPCTCTSHPCTGTRRHPPLPAPFVCEDDVRNAVKTGEKILVGEKTIITPAARDAGEAARVFIWQGYRVTPRRVMVTRDCTQRANRHRIK